MSTGRNRSQIARAPAPSDREAAAASENAPTTDDARRDGEQSEPADVVQPVHETCESHCWSVQTAPAVHREGVVVRETVLDHLAPCSEVEPAVVDDQGRWEDEQEDEAEAGEEDDEDVLLFRDPAEASSPDMPGVRHRV